MGTLSPDRICLLKRELNFLLWTADPPQASENEAFFRGDKPLEAGRINMQCATHAYITAALKAGSRLTLVEGQVYLANTPEWLHQVPKHYWISFNDENYADFSLQCEGDPPAVVGQRCEPSDWQLGVTQDPQELESILKEPGRSCIYVPFSHEDISPGKISQWMQLPFQGAWKAGIAIPLGKIGQHCDTLLQGKTQSLTSQTQIDAWRILALF